jgi:hypothetical protein
LGRARFFAEGAAAGVVAVELVEIGVLETGEQFVEEVEQLCCGLIGELRFGKPEGRVGLFMWRPGDSRWGV